MRSNSAARARPGDERSTDVRSALAHGSAASGRASGVLSTARHTVIDAMARQARDTLRQQAAAIASLGERIDERFGQAVRMLHATRGHVIVTGLGKSGHVGRKMAATFASTGTPSFFVHSTEALHGDLGMVTADDTVILVSYSGETAELLQLLPHLRARRVPTIGLVGVVGSTLAREVDVVLDVSVDREVCPHNLAPTSSTLTALAMGDTLAVSLMRVRSFDEDDFARLHPGGGLGRRLSKAVDAMIREGLVIVGPDAPVSECVLALAGSDLGVALVRDEEERIVGMITPVELQRAMTGVEGCLRAPAREIMTRRLPVVDGETSLIDAEALLEREDVPALLVLGDDGQPCGLLPRPRKR
jgi:arabinose-5-phosphate isomerase